VPQLEAEKQIYLKKKEIKFGFGGTAKTAEIKDYYKVETGDETLLKLRLLQSKPDFKKVGEFFSSPRPPTHFAEGNAFP
jgi:hypothetical protein